MSVAPEQGDRCGAMVDSLTVYHNSTFGVGEELFPNKGLGFMWGLHSYKKGGNVQCRKSITLVYMLIPLVQDLLEAGS